MPLSPPLRYLAGFAAAALGVFALIWLYVLAMPLGFLEGAYPDWVAKQSFIDACDLGTAVIVGDSRPEAAIDPRALSVPTRNLSFGAVTPVEEYFFLRRALQCPAPPRQVVLSFGLQGFMGISPFLWENAARFGYLSYGELNEIEDTAHALGNAATDRVSTRLGLTGRIRNLLYAIRFPPLYFNSLLQGQLFRRYDLNRAVRDSVTQALGHIPYDLHGAPPQVPAEALPDDFAPLPLATQFLDRTLTLLQARGVPAVFIPMPVSAGSARHMSPALAERFDAYLRDLAARYPGFHVAEPLIVVWPDSAFIDGVHLETRYAALFTARFDLCQQAALHSSGPVLSCDLSWETITAGARH